jgi:hypothetical protein
VDSFIGTTLPFRLEQSGGLNLFSAKDAKDAKYFWVGGFGASGRYAITACKF